MSACNHSQHPVSAAASGPDVEDHIHQDTHGPDQNKTTTITVGDILSVRQLVLRRGLAVLLMLVVLAAGIVASYFLTRLLKPE